LLAQFAAGELAQFSVGANTDPLVRSLSPKIQVTDLIYYSAATPVAKSTTEQDFSVGTPAKLRHGFWAARL